MSSMSSNRHALRASVVLLCICLCAGLSVALGDVLPHGLKIEKVLDSSAELGDLAQSPNGDLWILERSGLLRVISAGQEVATLNISVDDTCEGGLLDVAFAPDHAQSGVAFVYYVDLSGIARVDRVLLAGGTLSLDGTILNLGSAGDGCAPGGGLELGVDGKLYVATGGLSDHTQAPEDGSLFGKVLRMNLDGTVPGDNASGTLVYAKGFRHGADIALNTNTARAGGTMYMADLGASGVYDEVNDVRESLDYGWDSTSGPDGPGGAEDPLVDHNPTVGVRALASISGTSLGAVHQGSLVYACVDQDDLREAALTGAEFDTLEGTGAFYDPAAGFGAPDPGCPGVFHAIEEGADGALYMGNDGANPGIWRVWHDGPGAREVSAPGSPFPLTVQKSGGDVKIGWENIGTLDAGRPSRNAGQHAESYQVWEGSLPINGSYDHAAVLQTDGAPESLATLSATVSPAGSNRYFLVNAQNDNLEGSVGKASTGAERSVGTDYCETIGRGRFVGDCVRKWTDPRDGVTTLYLTDYNPYSETFMQPYTMEDMRGLVVRLDISALNCFWCDFQADYIEAVHEQFAARDFIPVTVMTQSYSTLAPIPGSNCETEIEDWAARNGEKGPILCDIDLDGNGRGDVTQQMWVSGAEGCGGTPHNFYIDQGHVIYDFVCGGETSSASMAARVVSEVNPETCE